MATIATINDIPVYAAEIGENEGMICISLVDDPAVQSDFLAFHDEEKPILFKVEDEAKHRLLGVVMRADYPIYRYNQYKGEFYMVFKPKVIREMAQKYLVDNNQNKVDLMHDGEMISGIEMVQWFIKDTAKGVNPIGFDKIADGSLFCEYQITDDDLWAEVIAGTYKGFSLEGYFGLVPERDGQYTDEIANEYQGLFNKLKSIGTNMAKVNKVKEFLQKMMVELSSITTDKGIITWDGDEDLKAGDAVFVEKEGEKVPAEDGEYRTDDNKIIVVESGVVKEIKDYEAEVDPEKEPEADPEEEAKKKKPCKGEGEEPAEEPAPEEPAEEPKDDKNAELVARIEALENQFADVIARLEALEGKPAAEEAHKQYRTKASAQNNENAVRIASALRR